jgi:hypothetical protein
MLQIQALKIQDRYLVRGSESDFHIRIVVGHWLKVSQPQVSIHGIPKLQVKP